MNCGRQRVSSLGAKGGYRQYFSTVAITYVRVADTATDTFAEIQ